jgi:retron-type reverse transcriptase
MPFITTKFVRESQITFEDIISAKEYNPRAETSQPLSSTKTIYRDNIPDNLLKKIDIFRLLNILKEYNKKYSSLIDHPNKRSLYYSFSIPKNSGGLRHIDAPLPPLMTALRELKDIFQYELYANYHTAAYAYIKGRCALHSLQRHQAATPRWGVEFDFSNFFGSTTLDFVMKQMEIIFPYSEIIKIESGRQELQRTLSLAFLDNGLPQGTPFSPLLTNIIMIPIDYELSKAMREFSPRITYTRYADDLFLSASIWNFSKNTKL